MRRIVTGHNAAGKSIVLFNDAVDPKPGHPSVTMWGNHETPANLKSSADIDPAEFKFNPPPTGALFRFAEIGPESATSHLAEEDLRKMVRDTLTDAGGIGSVIDQSRHWGMHRTRTIDYVVVLSGEVTLMLDEGEVALKPFDVVVQRGTNHAWVNKSTEPVHLLAVMVGADLDTI